MKVISAVMMSLYRIVVSTQKRKSFKHMLHFKYLLNLKHVLDDTVID